MPKMTKNGQIFKSSFYNSFMSLGNSAGPENPLGVIFMPKRYDLTTNLMF